MLSRAFLRTSLLAGIWSLGAFCLFVPRLEILANDSEKESQTSNGSLQGAESLPASEAEALGRARWIHEAMHGALQVMHRDFFGDGNDGDGGFLVLPSQSLEDVFKEMAQSWQVEIRWLGVNATKDIDHEPADDFERVAAEVLSKGNEEYSAIEKGRFRYVGAIQLQNECLKCHVPNRRSLEDRVAGLAISFPLAVPEKSED